MRLRFAPSLLGYFILSVVLAAATTHAQTTKVLTGKSQAYFGRSEKTDRVIDSDWRFIRQDVPDAQQVRFDDSSWTKLSLPHTWNNLDGQDGGNNYYRGPAWYRRHLHVDGGKSYFLRFDGAATVTDVYVNGTQIGTHRGNFGAFCFDATRSLHAGDNIIAVRVDNTHFNDVPPLSGDFTIFGGLYRDVHLLSLNDLSISPTDDASPGVYLRQTNVSNASADLRITTVLRNGAQAPKTASVTCTINDESGNSVASITTSDIQVLPGHCDVVQRIKLDHPHLWNGRSDAYLYHATITVIDGGKPVDQIVQPLGLRYYKFDPNKGFFLNGKYYPVHGVCRHQDRLNKGWAIDKQDQDQDMSIILEMGSTGVRLSHYEQANYFYGLCDKNGLVVWAEDGLVNQIHQTPAFYDNAKQQLRELIKQNYNHPSIIVWSLFNEIGFGHERNPQQWELIGQLNDLAHKLDDTRQTTSASNQPFEHPANWISDVPAFNRYMGWYHGTLQDWPIELDKIHAFRPDRSVGISEYGAGASIYMHEQPPTKPEHTDQPWHSEEYQCVYHEAVWRAIKARPWLWGTFLWNQFDFASDGRHEGDHMGRNDKGLVTYDRKTRKDAFYFYKANWTTTPVVHITARRFKVRPTGPMQIKVYSNCDKLSVWLNGHLLPATKPDTCVYLWNAELTPGENQVKAVGTKNNKKFTDEVAWKAVAGASNRYSDLPDK